MPIDKITVQGVRGIKGPLPVLLGGESLLLHGDNGTGKSSLERALRWALMGAEEPSDSNADDEARYRRHVRVAPDYPSVDVEFVDGSSISVQPGTVTASGNGAAIREACRKARPFLRRAELLDVLTSKPTDRFQYLESFLGLDQADQLIKDLGDQRSAIGGRATQVRGKIDAILAALALLLPRDYERPLSGAGYAAAATDLAKRLRLLGEDPGDWATQHKRVQDALAALMEGDTPRRRATVEQFRDDARALSAALEPLLLPNLETIANERLEVEGKLTHSEDVALLEHALAHFRREQGATCPVCEQAVDWQGTLRALEQKNAELAEFRRIRTTSHEAAAEWHQKALAFDVLMTRFAATMSGKVGIEEVLTTAPAGTDLLKIQRQADAERLYATLLGIGPARLQAYWITAITRAGDLAVEELKNLPRADDLPQIKMVAGLYERLSSDLPEILFLELDQRNAREDADTVERLLTALRHTRQDVAQETLKAIQGRVAEFYFAIHPRDHEDEATGAPSIEVQRHGKGTAFVRGEFVGKEVRDPQWVYSDGHLDTVGMCIFFALRRYRAELVGDPRIMVLDDIVISIDLSHARRLISLLKEKFSDHQILILTHNGLFAHWCKNLIPGLRRLHIKGWTIDGGPQIGEYGDALSRLTAAIGNGTAKEIGLALMEFLDEWTLEARYAYSVAVPAKYGEEYTLTEIWEPLSSTLKEIGKKLKSDLGGALGALEKLRDVPAVRNGLAAHENDFAREYPRDTMVEIATAGLKLADALYCLKCRQFVVPVPIRTKPSMMHCPKHHKQYVHAQRDD
jgi:AAA domain-containing protein